MDENVIVTTFNEDSKAFEALARLKELAAKNEIDLHDGAVVERVQDGTLHLRDEAVKARKELRHQRREATVEKVEAKLRELRERLRHLVHH